MRLRFSHTYKWYVVDMCDEASSCLNKSSMNASKLSEHPPDRGGKCQNVWVGTNIVVVSHIQNLNASKPL